MASRKEQKQQLREERQRREAEAAVDQHRKRRLAIAVGAALLAVAAVVALVIVNRSGTSSGTKAGTAAGAAEVSALLKGIPQAGNVLGDPKARVTINEFADLQCPACKALADKSLPDFIKSYVRSGKAKIEFRNLIIIGDQSNDAAKAALAAGEQDRQWNFVKLFYTNQGPENSGYVDDAFLTKIAKSAGVDVAAWNKVRKSDKLDAVLSRDSQEASSRGFSSTPSLVFTGPGGTQTVSRVLSSAELKQYVDQVAAKQ